MAALAQVCRYGRPGVHACCARHSQLRSSTPRDMRMCARNKKRAARKPTHKTREEPPKPPSTPHSQLHDALLLLEQNPRCLAGVWSSQLRCVKLITPTSFEPFSSALKAGNHLVTATVALWRHTFLLNQVITSTHISPFGTCWTCLAAYSADLEIWHREGGPCCCK